MQHPRTAQAQRGCVLAESGAAPSGLDAQDFDLGIAEEGVKQADRIGATADAGHERIGQAAGALEHLCARFASDHGLQFAHEVRIRMCADRRAQHVVGCLLYTSRCV